MIEYLVKSPIIFFLFALSLLFCLHQIRKLNEIHE